MNNKENNKKAKETFSSYTNERSKRQAAKLAFCAF